ncbi:hypothetical protein MHJ63_08675 [Pseudoglutamicibacter albus]|uniref:hypothetical protein n=1 Tax=Pseudoglutamicibacter albus TaxID=98671 RepID=UPI001EF656EA|nr:hypothetical protein [Pseudoglutamicibacter albus]MCG7305334.1 hypothetical protein [Pseudoglutamicibacter albus]
MKDPHSTYAKPFLIVPEQVRRLRERGMDCGDVGRTEVAKALLDWWQAPHVSSLRGETVEYRSPLDLLHELSEKDFEEIIENGNALSRFVAPG